MPYLMIKNELTLNKGNTLKNKNVTSKHNWKMFEIVIWDWWSDGLTCLTS